MELIAGKQINSKPQYTEAEIQENIRKYTELGDMKNLAFWIMKDIDYKCDNCNILRF